MRNAMLAILALSAATVGHGGGSSPAAAYDYPIASRAGASASRECSYSTYGQCMASASGRSLSCNVNPRVAFGQQRGCGFTGIIDRASRILSGWPD